MYKEYLNNVRLFIVFGGMVLFLSCSQHNDMPTTDFDKKVKVALREVGNVLLLAQNDTVSRVLPVKKTTPNTYKISFENRLAFDPSDLTQALQSSFEKASITHNYIVEVADCATNEITYSFMMDFGEENVIIPCGGRVVPKSCYTIVVAFTNISEEKESTNEVIFYILVTLVIAFLFLVFYSKYVAFKRKEKELNTTYLGSYKFYPEQNKLIKEAQEITLTKKESELLEILVANPNKVVKREELTKRVWEDNGVIVGRSLDTYISKLRKKLKDDHSVQITNVHGVGYKLEID